MAITAAVAKAIARVEAKLLDKINDAQTNGGSFLQQVRTVTIGGQPVAAKIGGLGGGFSSISGALSSITSAVQTAGDIATLVRNPMALVESAVGDAVSGVNGKLGVIADKLTGGQLSNITNAISQVSTKLAELEAHTSNLSGLSSAISDTVPDFKKIQNLGETLRGLGSDTTNAFLASTAGALKSGDTLNTIKDKLNISVQTKMDQILRLDETTISGQTEIAILVADINELLNTQAEVMNDIVTIDIDNFNEASNNLTASTDVVDLAGQYNDPESVTYALLVDLGVAKESTLDAFNGAIKEVLEEEASSSEE